jgi:hypothetical protein
VDESEGQGVCRIARGGASGWLIGGGGEGGERAEMGGEVGYSDGLARCSIGRRSVVER